MFESFRAVILSSSKSHFGEVTLVACVKKSHNRTVQAYKMGSMGRGDGYSVPEETAKLFQQSILGNPLIAKDLPKEFASYAETIKFEGSSFPSIPINWRFDESISALKGLEGLYLNALLAKKYAMPPQEVVVDT